MRDYETPKGLNGYLEEGRLFFIINPMAANGKAGKWWQKTSADLKAKGLSFKEAFTKGANQAQGQVKAAILEGSRLIIAVGGDGLVNEVLNGVLDEKGNLLAPDLIFGFWPVGTGCDFARSIFKSRKDEDLYGLLINGIVKRVDIGLVNCTLGKKRVKRFFLNSSDAGLGAYTCHFVNSATKFAGGRLSFMWAALKGVVSYKYQDIEVEYENNLRQGKFLMIFCNNSRYAGGGMKITPRAILDDCFFDLLIVRKMPKLKILFYFFSIYKGRHINLKEATYIKAKNVKIKGAPLYVETDGETPGKTPAEFSLLPKALPLLLPKNYNRDLFCESFIDNLDKL